MKPATIPTLELRPSEPIPTLVEGARQLARLLADAADQAEIMREHVNRERADLRSAVEHLRTIAKRDQGAPPNDAGDTDGAEVATTGTGGAGRRGTAGA